MVYNMVVTAVQ